MGEEVRSLLWNSFQMLWKELGALGVKREGVVFLPVQWSVHLPISKR